MYAILTFPPKKGVAHGPGEDHSHNLSEHNFYRCDNCYAEFMEDDQIELKKKFEVSENWEKELERIEREAINKVIEQQEMDSIGKFEREKEKSFCEEYW